MSFGERSQALAHRSRRQPGKPKTHLLAPQYGDDVGSIYERSECGKLGVVTSDVARVTCNKCLKLAGCPLPGPTAKA